MRPIVLIELAEYERWKEQKRIIREYIHRTLRWLTLNNAQCEDKIKEAIKMLQDLLVSIK